MTRDDRSGRPPGVARRSVLRAAAAAGGMGVVGLVDAEGGPDLERSEPLGTTRLTEVSLVHEYDGSPMVTDADRVARYVVDPREDDLLLLPNAGDRTEELVLDGEHTVRAQAGAGDERFLRPGPSASVAGESSPRAYFGPGSFVHLREDYRPPSVGVRRDGTAVRVETDGAAATADAGERSGRFFEERTVKAYEHPTWEETEVTIRPRLRVRNYGELTVRRVGSREDYPEEPTPPEGPGGDPPREDPPEDPDVPERPGGPPREYLRAAGADGGEPR